MSRVEILLTLLLVTALVGGAVYLGKLDARLKAVEKDKDLAAFQHDRDAALALIDKARDQALAVIRSSEAENPKIRDLEQKVGALEAALANKPDERQSERLALLEERMAVVESFFTKKRPHQRDSVAAPGAAPWGTWKGPAFCPANYFVCGIEQKVEVQQGNGDDTAVNGVRVYCCPL
jgi:hypothetical protein